MCFTRSSYDQNVQSSKLYIWRFHCIIFWIKRCEKKLKKHHLPLAWQTRWINHHVHQNSTHQRKKFHQKSRFFPLFLIFIFVWFSTKNTICIEFFSIYSRQKRNDERINSQERDIQEIFGDETESDLSCSDESDEEVEMPVFHRKVRTRGGIQPQSARPPINNDWVDWKDAPYIPSIPPFTNVHGPTIVLPQNVRDFVELFITVEFIDLIVEQTNLYATQHLRKSTLSPYARANDWKPVVSTVSNILIFEITIIC